MNMHKMASLANQCKQRLDMFPMLIILLLFLVKTSNSVRLTLDDYYNIPNCYNSSTLYSLNSSYETNLNNLLSTLVSQISTSKSGFVTHKQGSDNQDPAYGLALCRGDLNTNECYDCIKNASQLIITACPRASQAIYWKEQCTIRYSNYSFLSIPQELPYTRLYNSNNITGNLDAWTKTLQDSLNEVRSKAANNSDDSGKKFAVKETWVSTSNQYLYTLAQCNPDLTGMNCTNCLNFAVDQFVTILSPGGIVATPSCSLRYETYQFYRILSSGQSPSPSSAPSTNNRGRKKAATTKVVVPIIVVTLAVLGMLFVLGICHFRKKAKKHPPPDIKNVLDDLTTAESLMFTLGTLEAATYNFSDDKKLGQGGFGSVYKGTLENGQEIAVKRLSKISSQGVDEFKNEVILIANLQHRNLVKLLGFCLAGEEKLLVYEFVPNKSLNYFLFDPRKQKELNWSKRYDIIKGIARGLLYLHEDSRPRIIHRDLKSGNILLDANMNPKIADFGLARIFKVEQTVDDTSRVVGTYGYMAPEYAMHGQFSVKSDVYSFGVLVLEIVSGKKISARFHPTGDGDLLTNAWRSLTEERPMDFMDPTLNDSYSSAEMLRCIQIGLWCAQESTNGRPTMSTVFNVLNNEVTAITIPIPQCPRSFYNSSTETSLLSRITLNSTTTSNNTSESRPDSQNQHTISEIYPR